MSDQNPHPGDIRHSQIPVGCPNPPPPPSGLRCVIYLKSIGCHTESLFWEIFVCVRNISALAGSEDPQDCICRFPSLNYLLLIHLRNISAVFNTVNVLQNNKACALRFPTFWWICSFTRRSRNVVIVADFLSQCSDHVTSKEKYKFICNNSSFLRSH